MTKVRELVNFQEIREVVQVTRDDPKELVSTFVVSDKMKKDIELIVNNLVDIKHKSIFIIGDYGTGKSHFLGFITNVAKDNSLIDLVRDKELNEFLKEKLNEKDFVVVVKELGPSRLPLGLILYLILWKQLKKEYGIEINVPQSEEDYNRIIDHKTYIVENIIRPIKSVYPERGIIVAFDELSDFIKQKKREDVAHDMQFLRILGELSEKEDIIFIFSMQENIFRSDIYVDQSDAMRRVHERYHLIEITKEDIEKVISERIVPKTPDQIAKLRKLLSQYKEYYEDFEGMEEQFIRLYPLHPSILRVFRQLPYFQKRGILKFSIDKIKEILDEEFPKFVTIEMIFDEIQRNPTISNMEKVRDVLDVAERLLYKIQIDQSLRRDRTSERIVKALAVYKLMEPEERPTIQQLAHELMIIPRFKEMNVEDYLIGIIRRIKKQTAGQFLGYDKNEQRAYLDLEKRIDYDEIINRRINTQSDHDREFYLFRFLSEELDIESPVINKPSIKVYETTAYWESRNSFREGYLVFEGKDLKELPAGLNLDNKDFKVILVSPYKSSSIFKPSDSTVIIHLKLEESEESVKRYSAIRGLLDDRQYTEVMRNRLAKEKRILTDKLLEDLKLSRVLYNKGKSILIGDIIEDGEIHTILEKLKTKLLSDYFNSKYHEYPRFTTKITPNNIGDIARRVIEDILSSPDPRDYKKDTLKVLSDLELYTQGRFKIMENPYISKLSELLSGERVKEFKSIVKKMAEPPFGLQPELVYIIVALLLINEEVELKKATHDYVLPMELRKLTSRKGIEALNIIKYIKLASELPTSELEQIFNALDLDPSKIRIKSERLEGLKEFKIKITELEEGIREIENLKENLDKLRELGLNTPDEKIKELISLAEDDELLKQLKSVNTIHDFKKIVKLSVERMKAWKESIEQIKRLSQDLKKIVPATNYVIQAFGIITNNPRFFIEIYAERLKALHSEIIKVLNSDSLLDVQERLPLIGKLEEFKRLYREAYIEAHKRYFENENWGKLFRLLNSQEMQELDILKMAKCIDAMLVDEIFEEIHDILKRRCDPEPKQDIGIYPKCVCGFPENHIPLEELDNKTKSLEEKIKSLRRELESIIVEEIRKVKERIEYLKPNEREIMKTILQENSLGEVTPEKIAIINKLFEDFQIVEIRLEEFYEWLKEEGFLLTLNEIKKKFDEFISMKVPNSNKVRIKIVK